MRDLGCGGCSLGKDLTRTTSEGGPLEVNIMARYDVAVVEEKERAKWELAVLAEVGCKILDRR